MAEQKLSLIVELVNKTDAKFKEIGDSMKAASKQTENMTAAFGGIAKVGGIAFTAIAGIGVAALKAYADAEREMVAGNIAIENAITSMSAKQRKASTGFTDTAAAITSVKKAMDAAGESAIRLGFDDEAASVAFAKLYQASGDVTTAQSDLKVAMDLAAFSGKDLGTTTRSIMQAYAGGAKVLKEFGIELEDGASKSEIIAAAQAKSAGAAERASATLVGQMNRMKIEMANVAEEVGKALAPALQNLVTKLEPILRGMADWVKKNADLVASIILWGGAVAGIITAVGAMGLAVLTAQKYVLMLRAAMVLLAANPLVLAIMAAVLALTFLYNQLDAVAEQVGGFGNAIKLILNMLKNEFWKFADYVSNLLKNMTDGIPVIGDALSWVSSKIASISGESQRNLNTLSSSLVKAGQSSQTMSTQISTEVPKVNNAIGTMPKASKEATEAAKKHFENMVSAVAEIKKNIISVYAEIKQASLDYEKSVTGEKKSFEQEVISTVANANVKKKDLEADLQQAISSGDVSRIQEAQKNLNEQLAIITTYQQSRLQLDAQVAAEQQRLGMNELQRIIYDHAQKLTLMQNEYQQEQAQRQQRIIELQAEQTQILAMTSAKKAAAIKAEADKQVSIRETIATSKLLEKNWLAESLTNWQNYANSVAAVMASINNSRSSFSTPAYGMSTVSGKRASGGTVQPGRTFLVGEKGPELFTPSQYGNIQANGSGGGITLVITGNSFFGEEDLVDKVGTSIMKALQQNVKL